MNTLSRTQVLNELFDDQPHRGLQKPNGQLQPDPGVPDGEQGRTECIKTQNTYSPDLKRRPDDRRHAPRPHAAPPLLETGARAQLLQSVAPS